MRLNPLRGSRHSRLRTAVTAGAALALGAGIVVVAASQASAAAGCKVTYTITNSWPGGFGANVAVQNLGDPLSSWTLTWSFANGQTISSGWNGQFSQSGANVTVTNMAWNGSLGTNATVTPGFNGSWNGTNAVPASFALNGTTCNGPTPSNPPTSVRPSSPQPSSPRPSSPRPSSVGPSSPRPSGSYGTHVDNPYAGAQFYVNPDWSAKAAAESGGSRVSNTSTGIWLDRIAAIAGTGGAMGLQAQLDNAVSKAGSTPMLIQFVIYDLPGRDCAALASNGELGPTEIGRYETEYIDPIASIMSNPKYAALRIVTIIEIDSLPNLVTNVSGNTATSACQTMQQNGNYVTGVQYALNKLHAIPNVYTYIDAAHHGWLGWDSNFGPAADLFAQVAKGTTAGVGSVDGFITNTANYSALSEPYFTINTSVNGQSVKNSKWVDYNSYVDELTFTQAFRSRLVSNGFSSGLGMLIDTSRNGWGGTARPTKASTSTDLNTFVNESKVDRRIHAGNWCNQSGAGMGERPKANPGPSGIDAYVWIKPPGESDGSSTQIPNDQGKGFDQMCDPNYGGNIRNQNNKSGALPNAPLSGDWFSAQFQELMKNAYPAL